MAVLHPTPCIDHQASRCSGDHTCTSPPFTGTPPHSQFALARIHGDVVLVQIPHITPDAISRALVAVDVKIFRHEFITLFRYARCASFHPSDVQILERIDDTSILYEEEKGTVWLAKDVVARLQSMSVSRHPLSCKAATIARRCQSGVVWH